MVGMFTGVSVSFWAVEWKYQVQQQTVQQGAAVLLADQERGFCYKWTGGTCRFLGCKAERHAKCDAWFGTGSHRCLCPDGSCVNTDGVCVPDKPQLVASGIKLRSPANTKYTLQNPAKPDWLNEISLGVFTAAVVNVDGGKDTWDLYKLSGTTPGFVLTGAGEPDALLGWRSSSLPIASGLDQVGLGDGCLSVVGPNTDPWLTQFIMCRLTEGHPELALIWKDYNTRAPDYLVVWEDVLGMRSCPSLSKAYSSMSGDVNTTDYSSVTWIPDPPIDLEFPMCRDVNISMSWEAVAWQSAKSVGGRVVGSALTFTNQLGKQAYDAVVGKSGLFDCLETLGDKWSLKGVFDTVASHPDNAVMSLYNRYLEPIIDDILGYQPLPHDCDSESYVETAISNVCILGHRVDFSEANWSRQLLQPTVDTINQLVERPEFGPFKCLWTSFVEPALDSAIWVMALSIKQIVPPLQLLAREIRTVLPYADRLPPSLLELINVDSDNVDSDHDANPSALDFGRRLLGNAKGNSTRAHGFLSAIFKNTKKFFNDTKNVLKGVPGDVLYAVNSSCNPSISGRGLTASDGLLALEASVALKVVNDTLVEKVFPLFKKDVITPELDAVKKSLSSAWAHSSLATVGVGGIFPEIGGVLSALLMAGLTEGFMALLDFFASDLFNTIEHMLSILADTIASVGSIMTNTPTASDILGGNNLHVGPLVVGILDKVLPAIKNAIVDTFDVEICERLSHAVGN